MNIKYRIVEYLKHKGVSITKAEQSLGWSKSSLLKSNNLSSDKISELILYFDDLSAEWLLTGKGPMLKPEYTTSKGDQVHYEGNFHDVKTHIGNGSSIQGDVIAPGGTKGNHNIAGNTIGSGSSITGAGNQISYAQQRKAEKLAPTAGIALNIDLLRENERLKSEIEKLQAEIERLKMGFELKDTIIQAKDELIKLLSEKK